jgi:uncharacterized membrane protein YdjX (TVP38/TMEM64 family)
MVVVLLASFLIFEGTGASQWLALPEPGTTAAGVVGVVGFGLLVLDVFLPVPSSVIMIANGALFGWAFGTLVSAAGATAATLLGWGLGRLGRDAFRRWVRPEAHARAVELFRRHGALAVVVTRPVPIVAETVAIVAGASGMRAGQAAISGILGSLPAAAVYAWAGARGLGAANDAAVFGLVIGLAALLWWLGERSARSGSADAG